MVLALVLLSYALILGLLLSCTSSAGKADDRESRLIQLSLRALGDSQMDRDRRRHYARCDAHARPGHVEILPSASRRGRAA